MTFNIIVLVVSYLIAIVCFAVGIYGLTKGFKKGAKIAYTSKRANLSEATWKLAQKIEGIWFVTVAPAIAAVITALFVLRLNDIKEGNDKIFIFVSLGSVIFLFFIHSFIIEGILASKFDKKGVLKSKSIVVPEADITETKVEEPTENKKEGEK